MAVRTGSEAIRWMNGQHRGWAGWCLKFVRTSFNVGAKYTTAYLAWLGAKKKHRVSLSNAHSIPAGVPVFFTIYGNPAGHVALSVGGGRIRTDIVRGNTVKTITCAQYVAMGAKLLGWTEDLNGVKVYNKKANKPTKKKYTYIHLQKSVSRWAVYPTNKAPIKKNAKGYLNPKKFGGLDYRVLKWDDKAKTVAVIQSPAFGKVKIYVAPTTGAKIYSK